MGKLSEQQIVEIAEKRELGWSYNRIARHFGISTGAVHYQCLRQGAVSPHGAPPRLQHTPITIRGPSGRVQRRFTVKEDEKLLALSLENRTMSDIARQMGRPKTSVRIRLMTLALHQDAA